MTKQENLTARKQKVEEKIIDFWINKKISTNTKEFIINKLNRFDKLNIILDDLEESISSGYFIKTSLITDAFSEREKEMIDKRIDIQDALLKNKELYGQTMDSLENKKLIERKGNTMRPESYINTSPSTITNLSDTEFFVYKVLINYFNKEKKKND